MDVASLRAAVAARPILDTVGDLVGLLSRLPQDMALTLDEQVRVDPSEPGQLYAVTPRLIGMVDTDSMGKTTGLELGLVCVPAHEDPAAQAAAVTARDSLVPENVLARAEVRIESGDVQAGLKDVGALLKEVGYLLGESAKWLAKGDPNAATLGVEADRIGHACARITQLANTVEVPE
ncbi:hypothetical protein [Streptomyces nojiriensis]|uniref:hypothetical protein n=1 Tax=Streptomyces nojiriensis TaxID=66374 RepID=UPI00365A2828